MEQITKRLRKSGQLPRFVAPAGTEPPPQLKGPPSRPIRLVGRRKIEGEGGYLLAACSAITQAGTRCKGTPIDHSGLCFVHHPDHVEARKRAGRKGGKRGGRGRPSVEVAELKGQLSDLYESVLSGATEPKVGAVAAQIANARARLVETELKVREMEELEAKLEEMAAALERREGYAPTG